MAGPETHSTNETIKPAAEGSTLEPFRYATFTVLWIATVVANVGVWMQNAAAGWLMTGLTPDPFLVSLVQVATSVPIFVLALPAGALADIVDRRRLLIAVQTVSVLIVAAFGFLVWAGRVTPAILLTFVVVFGTGAALIMPAWQSIVPQLVPRAYLQPAVALNGVGLNVSRAIGPALAGLVIAVWGLASPFWVNAVTTIGVVVALIWWRPKVDPAASRLPAERFYRAIAAGLRHARYNSHLRATLIRAAGFFIVASAYWALLPLVARQQIAGGPTLYGILLGAIGAGAVCAAFALPFLKRHLGPNRLVAAAVVGTACALILFGLARKPPVALAASVLAGVSWISVLATVNVSAQVALPGWVRGRGLSIFVAVMFGCMTAGSALWGKLAVWVGLSTTLFVAGAAGLVTIPLLWRWRLQTGAGLDLTPSMHWPEPIISETIEQDRGPVLVTVEYLIRPEDRAPFLEALTNLGGERRRDGAFDWWVFEDVAKPGRYVETFMLDSWIEHMRQHARVSNTDRELQERVRGFHIEGVPQVTHLVAAT
jgi:predicted MFS family arabinose efflux permease